MATYRIGPDDFFTGKDLQADAYTLNSMVQAVERVISAVPNSDTRLTDDLFQSWAAFSAQWNPYFVSDWDYKGDLSNFFTALNDGNRDQLIQYESRFASIYSQLKEAGFESAYVNVELSQGAPDTVKRLFEDIYSAAQKLGGVWAGAIILVVVAVLVWTFVIPRLTA